MILAMEGQVSNAPVAGERVLRSVKPIVSESRKEHRVGARIVFFTITYLQAICLPFVGEVECCS